MTDTAILTGVKTALGITGPYHDDTISIYIAEVQDYMRRAGVPDDAVSVGVVARGVSDLWNNGSGEVKLSPYFRDRVAQLALGGE